MRDLSDHAIRTRDLMAELEEDRRALGHQMLAALGGDGAAVFPLDFLALAAIKRNASLSSAVAVMISHWNMAAARTLLRSHIDTGLRFSAAWLVEKPHDFASAVLGGARIDRMKLPNGQKLTDGYLVKTRSAEYPWLPAVYEKLSGYVHFSGSHIFDTATAINEKKRSVEFETAVQDAKYPEFSWNEVLECTRSSTGILRHYLEGYSSTKKLSSEELAARRDG